MENNDHTPDLQEMRSRLDLLERRIKDENMVNEKLLRHIMGSKAADMGKRMRQMTVLAVLAIPYTVWAFHQIGCSLPFLLVTWLFLLAAIVYDLYSYRLLRATDFAAGNLLDASRHMVRMKRLYARWLYFAIPFICVWVVWLAVEAYRNFADAPGFLNSLYAGFGCGAAIGGLFGYMYYRKTQRTIAEILKGIQEITGTAS